MLTNYVIIRLVSEFVLKLSLKLTLHLKRVTMLPCEIFGPVARLYAPSHNSAWNGTVWTIVCSSIFSRPLQCNVRLLSWDVVCLSVVCNTRVLWPNGFMDQDATWYGGRPWPKWHCIRWGPNSIHPKGHSSPPKFFLAHVYCGQTAAWIRMLRGMQIGLYALLGEAIFSACHTNPNPAHWRKKKREER